MNRRRRRNFRTGEKAKTVCFSAARRVLFCFCVCVFRFKFGLFRMIDHTSSGGEGGKMSKKKWFWSKNDQNQNDRFFRLKTHLSSYFIFKLFGTGFCPVLK